MTQEFIQISPKLMIVITFSLIWKLFAVGLSITTCFFNSQKFHICPIVRHCLQIALMYVYINPDQEIINPANNVLDLGIFMYGDCSFEFHIKNVCKNVQTYLTLLLCWHYLNHLCYLDWTTDPSYGPPIWWNILTNSKKYMLSIFISPPKRLPPTLGVPIIILHGIRWSNSYEVRWNIRDRKHKNVVFIITLKLLSSTFAALLKKTIQLFVQCHHRDT